MAARIPSDHPSIVTVRGTVERRGGTRRPQVVVPAEARDRIPADEVIRLVLDGREYHARPDRRHGDDAPVIRGAFDNARLARSPGEGANRLTEWIRENDLDVGRSVSIDVVVPSFRYGLRVPGTEAVYDASEPPAAGLRDIASRLTDDT